MDNDKLLDIGTDFLYKHDQPDSALLCFSVVINRTNPDMSPEEADDVVAAYNSSLAVYSSVYFDYVKSIECLNKALEICWKFNRDKGVVYINFGNLYQTIANESNNLLSARKALRYYHLAFEALKKNKNEALMLNTLMNMVSVTDVLHSTDSIAPEYEYMVKHYPPNGNFLREYIYRYYRVTDWINKGQPRKALKLLAEMERLKSDGKIKDRERYQFITLDVTAKTYILLGDYANAVKYAKKVEDIAEAGRFRDEMLEAYKLLGECYRQSGNFDLSTEYKEKYEQLNDSLQSDRLQASFSEMQFLDNMQKVNEELQRMKRRSELQAIAVGIAAVIVLLVVFFLILLYKRNRKLHEANVELYQRNVEMLENEERERKQREALEQLQHEHYKDSKLDEETKSDLSMRITLVMENNEEVYSPNFTVDRLAELAQMKRKQASQVISEVFGCNFNTLLNSYRMKEACKRMNDLEHYGNLTLAAIANSVGIKSSDNFRVIFKKMVGLSPSEYLRIAKAKAKEQTKA
jgi:AraC-like DNA-binding protein